MYYGMNPQAYLAQTGYSNMTGMTTQINPQQIPNAASYMQPMFVDMNAYNSFNGIPTYPSFIGGTAMMNPQVPIAQPSFGYSQPSFYGQQTQPSFYGQQTQPSFYGQQQYPMSGQQSSIANIINNFLGCGATVPPPQQQPPLQQNQNACALQSILTLLLNMLGIVNPETAQKTSEPTAAAATAKEAPEANSSSLADQIESLTDAKIALSEAKIEAKIDKIEEKIEKLEEPVAEEPKAEETSIINIINNIYSAAEDQKSEPAAVASEPEETKKINPHKKIKK